METKSKRVIGERTGLLVSSLESLMESENHFIEYFSLMWGDTFREGEGDDLWQKSGIPQKYEEIRNRIKEYLGESVLESLVSGSKEEI